MTYLHSATEKEFANDLVGGIANRLRHQIVEGELSPGERIFEAQVARTLGTSRAPVREASRLLEREGLLVSQANRGFLVRELTIRELIDTTDLRTCVESYAVQRVAAGSKLDQLLEALDGAATEIENRCRAGDRPGQVAADFAFHRLVVENAGNRRLLTVFDQIATELRIAMRLMGAATADWESLARSHRELIEALGTRDPAKAEAAVKQHIHLAWDQTIELLRSKMDGSLRLER